MEDSPQPLPIRHLVVDAGALIRGDELRPLAEHFYTCREVLMEIRDRKARARLEHLPFELKVIEPSDEAMRAVVAFSKETGDFFSLSKPDLLILALARSLEEEYHGKSNGIRDSPAKPGNFDENGEVIDEDFTAQTEEEKAAIAAAEAQQQKEHREKLKARVVRQGTSWASAVNKTTDTPHSAAVSAAHAAARLNPSTAAGPSSMWDDEDFDTPAQAKEKEAVVEEYPALQAPEYPAAEVDPLTMLMAATSALSTAADNVKEPESSNDTPEVEPESATAEEDVPEVIAAPIDPKTITSKIMGKGGFGFASTFDASQDDGEGWATGNSISLQGPQAGWYAGPVVAGAEGEKKKMSNSNVLTASTSDVACITADFAMQNVLLQMRLRIVAIDGRTVERVRHWVLKCDSCYQMCPDVSKRFCPSCGNATLAKLAYSVRPDGVRSYHYKRNRRINFRGSKYSLPMPKGGREGDLLLREDQLMVGVWSQRAQKRDSNTSMFGEDVTDSLGLALSSAKKADVQIGFGRRNPNSMRGRERRGKKKSGAKKK